MKKTLLFLSALLLINLVKAQDNNIYQVENNSDEIVLDITKINTFEQRMHFVYSLFLDERFNINTSDRDGFFIISKQDNDEEFDILESFYRFCEEESSAFRSMSKEEAGEYFHIWKAELPENMVTSMMSEIYNKGRMNNLCENSEPFCTDNDLYIFEAGVNAGSGETGPNYNCLKSQPNPAWYYMRIDHPGGMLIEMGSNPQKDIDYCCWGPFDDPFAPCPNGLTGDKVVSCSYSSNYHETCEIPNTATTGEYYILIITNYSNQQCTISFEKTSGEGTTDCSILPPLIECNYPCYGGTLTLSAQNVTNAIYSWTGPNGFTSNERQPVIPNVTMEHSGTYSCTITVGQQTSEPMSIDIEILPNTVADFEYAPGCAGNATGFLGKDKTSPEGYDDKITRRVWDFGDGSPTVEGETVTHTYSIPGDYNVTYTIATENSTYSCEDNSLKSVISIDAESDFEYESTCFGDETTFFGTEHTFPEGYNHLITNREWHFSDDNSTSYGSEAKHVFNDYGTFDVTYIISSINENGLFFSDTVTKPVNIGIHYTPGCEFEYDSIYKPEIVCENFYWNGQYYYYPGAFSHTYNTQSGCDSIVTLHIDKVYSNFTLNASIEGQDLVQPSYGMMPNYYTYKIEGLTEPIEGDVPSYKWEIYSYYDTPNHVADSTNSGSTWYHTITSEDSTQVAVCVNEEGNALLKCIINSKCGTTYLEKFIYTEGFQEGYFVDENTLESNLKIFPNPVKDMLFISYGDGDVCLPMNIAIYNSFGFLTDEIKTNSSDIVSYSMKNLPDGVYFIRISINDSQVVRKILFRR